MGVGGALLFLPIIALGGYGLISFGAFLILVKWVKAIENGTDYSLMNTTKAALFLITSREEKYKAKAAIDTFFVRGGDALAALCVFIGTTYFALNHRKVRGHQRADGPPLDRRLLSHHERVQEAQSPRVNGLGLSA